MRAGDQWQWVKQSLWMEKQRSALSMLGIAIGVAAIVLLSAIGNGLKAYLNANFAQFGTRLLVITPGNEQTHGLGALLQTDRPLTLADANALGRLNGITAQVPVVAGTGPIQYRGRTRHTDILGVNHNMPEVWRLEVGAGQFFPASNSEMPRPITVLGKKVAEELYGNANPLGTRLRVGGERYLVVGVMARKGQILGYDMDDIVYIPTARALKLFNRESLMEIDLNFSAALTGEQATARVKQLLIQRHGSEDFTIMAQDQMLETLDNILGVVTAVIFAIGTISLLVGAVGITTIMSISVRQRAAEIGLMRALGANETQILRLFLFEAIALTLVGGVIGAGVIALVIVGLQWTFSLPLVIDWAYIGLALLLCIFVGLASGIMPAHRAAALDPVQALQSEA